MQLNRFSSWRKHDDHKMVFTFEDLIQLYGKKKELYCIDTYRHISEILKEAKILHKKYFMTTGKLDRERRAFKGKNLEKLIIHILTDEIHALGLKLTSGNTLEQTSSSNLDSDEQGKKKSFDRLWRVWNASS